MVTDTQRIMRTDPGRPEVCNVCQLHRFFGDDYEEIWDGERTARTGCVDTKKLLAERIIRHYAPARERYLELMAHPAEVERHPRGGRRPAAPLGPGDDGRGPRARWACARRLPWAALAELPPRTRRPRAAVEPGPGRIQIDLSERQQRLLDAFLILATIAAAFVVLGFVDNAFKAFQDIIILFFLAWLLSFALLPLINARGAPDARARRVRPRSWSSTRGIVVVVLALLRPGRGLPRATRSPSSSGPPRSWRPSSGASSRAIEERLAGARLRGRAREPGADHHPEPERLRPGAGRADPAGGVREHRAGRQPPDPRDALAVHRDRPRRDPGVPLPPRAAQLPRRGAAAPEGGWPVVRRVPPRAGRDGRGLRPRSPPIANIDPGLAVWRGDLRRLGPAPHDPVLRPVRVVAAAGRRWRCSSSRRPSCRR